VTIGSLVVMIAIGLLFSALGARKRQAGLLGIATPAEETRRQP